MAAFAVCVMEIRLMSNTCSSSSIGKRGKLLETNLSFFHELRVVSSMSCVLRDDAISSKEYILLMHIANTHNYNSEHGKGIRPKCRGVCLKWLSSRPTAVQPSERLQSV